MATVVLFHSALGLRPAVLRVAETWRRAGHTVHTPDLFEGEVFDDLEEGVKKRDALGIPELSRRALAAVADLPEDVVYAGFSMGAASAEHLALTRPGARGCLLMHGVLPPALLGVDGWPDELPVQLHVAEGDPWVPPAMLGAFRDAAKEADVFVYPHGGHLFTDEESPDADAEGARLVAERAAAFLASIDAAAG